MLHIIRYTAAAIIRTESGMGLNRLMEFLTEEEVDAFIAANPDDGYEKIPVWSE